MLDMAGLEVGTMERPCWFALTTPPQKERAARAFLMAQGISPAFFPSENRISTIRGKKRVREAPLVGGYVFALFQGYPLWHVLKEQAFFTGVVCLGNRPVVMPRGTIRRLQGLTVEAAERRRELRELREQLRLALMPVEGEGAKIVDGPLNGFTVNVLRIKDGVAFYTLPGGLKGSATVSALERLQ